jgi:hypothetical protein
LEFADRAPLLLRADEVRKNSLLVLTWVQNAIKWQLQSQHIKRYAYPNNNQQFSLKQGEQNHAANTPPLGRSLT